jgi:hypothetical protein
MRMMYRNRKEALKAWRSQVRDSAVLALAIKKNPMLITELAATLGIDVGALFGLLVNDQRFRMDLSNVRRGVNQCGYRMARFVALVHQGYPSDHAQVPQAAPGKMMDACPSPESNSVLQKSTLWTTTPSRRQYVLATRPRRRNP